MEERGVRWPRLSPVGGKASVPPAASLQDEMAWPVASRELRGSPRATHHGDTAAAPKGLAPGCRSSAPQSAFLLNKSCALGLWGRPQSRPGRPRLQRAAPSARGVRKGKASSASPTCRVYPTSSPSWSSSCLPHRPPQPPFRPHRRQLRRRRGSRGELGGRLLRRRRRRWGRRRRLPRRLARPLAARSWPRRRGQCNI